MRSLALALVVPPRSPLQDASTILCGRSGARLRRVRRADDHLPGLPASLIKFLGVLPAANDPLAADLLDAAAQAA